MARAFPVICGLLLLLDLVASAAQANTALIADTIRYDPAAERLIATGNVQVLSDGEVITADQIIYDNATGRITAIGAVELAEPGAATLVAQSAELQTETRNALIQGARLVLAQNFEFAAAEARTSPDGVTRLYKTVGSSCHVCASDPVPLWLVRAEQIVRDPSENRIHVRNAFFDVAGVTVGYVPYFSFPDPTVDRATGILQPEFRTSDVFGFGTKVPYFVIISDHADTTITPFLTSGGAAIVEGEYRQIFRGGRVTVSGALAAETLTGQPSTRGFLTIEGDHALPDDFRLYADIAVTSDNGFLRTYGYDTADRLYNTLSATRQRLSERTEISLVGIQSLRSSEDQLQIPFVLPEFSYRRYWDSDFYGGRMDISASGSTIIRLTGRDVAKVQAGGEWSRREVLPGGVVARIFGQGEAAIYWTADDASVPSPLFVTAPTVGAELRWPLMRNSAMGRQIVEPVAQLIYTGLGGDWASVPNEDSQLAEFDAANLFSRNRHPGSDLREEGLRLNLGGNFQWQGNDGRQATLALGQVFRVDPTTGFGIGTGLNGQTSHIVAAANVDLPPHLSLSNQTLFDERLDFYRNDVQANINYQDFALTANYVYFDPDPSSGLTQRHEFILDGRYQLADNWAFSADWRRDLATGRNVNAGAALEFLNECFRAEISASRRFTESSNVPSSTEYGFAVGFVGLGLAPEAAGPGSACMK